MVKHVIEGDVFLQLLISNSSLLNDGHKDFLHSRGLDLSTDLKDIALQLRRITVNEWLEHSSLYNGFLFVLKKHQTFCSRVLLWRSC